VTISKYNEYTKIISFKGVTFLSKKNVYFHCMREEFISYLWKFQQFNTQKLTTADAAKELEIITVGQENRNAGPDFFNAQVIINNQKWAGTVELHVNASDWYVHGHEKDANYDNVILHVVWENDAPVYRKDNTLIPSLELKNIVNQSIIANYKKLFSTSEKWINCEDSIADIDDFTRNNWLERIYIERLEQKSTFVLQLLEQSKNDWEAVLFKLLLKNFGLKVNGDAFFVLSNTINFSILRKEQYSLTFLEALLFGCAGLLESTIEDAYFETLEKEFNYLKVKHKLSITSIPVQFFRLRPANFPTIRLAQFASLYHKYQTLFSTLMNVKDLKSIYTIFEVSASEFWNTHYTFEATSKHSKKKLSKSFIDLLLINTIIPLKFVYQNYIGKPNDDLIISMMNKIKPEKNSIINKFSTLKMESVSAFSSQALLQLKNEYCNKQRCLQCAIGNQILSAI